MRAPHLLAAVFLAVSLGATADAGDLHGITGFDEYAEDHPGVAAAVARHPSLVHDAEYLKHHESLAQFLRTHPLARIELEGEDDEDEPNPILKEDAQEEAAKRRPKPHYPRFPPPHPDE